MSPIHASFRKHRLAQALAACIGIAGAGVATAQQVTSIDLNQRVLEILTPAGVNAIYQQKMGRPMPPNVTAAATFTGEIEEGSVKYLTPPAIISGPERLAERLVCNPSSGFFSTSVKIEKSVEIGSTISRMDSLSTTSSVNINLKIPTPKGPIDLGSINKSSTTTAANTATQDLKERITWGDEAKVLLLPRGAARVRLIVDQDKIQPTPFAADLVLRGNVTLTYQASGPTAKYVWVRVVGNTLPANILLAPAKNGKRAGFCKMGSGPGAGLVGKFWGRSCYVKPPGPAINDWRADGIGVWVLTGSQDTFDFGGPYEEEPFYSELPGEPQGAKVCMVDFGAEIAPGYVMDGRCWVSGTQPDSVYAVLKTPRQAGTTVTVPLESVVRAKELRRVKLEGVFTNVRQQTAAAIKYDMPLQECLNAAGNGASMKATGAQEPLIADAPDNLPPPTEPGEMLSPPRPPAAREVGLVPSR
jgi:hypothetical protein